MGDWTTCSVLSTCLCNRPRVEAITGRLISGICEQRRPRSACASAQSDQGLRFPLTEWLVTIKCISGKQMPGWDCACADKTETPHFVHVRRHLFAWRDPYKKGFIFLFSFYVRIYVDENLFPIIPRWWAWYKAGLEHNKRKRGLKFSLSISLYFTQRHSFFAKIIERNLHIRIDHNIEMTKCWSRIALEILLWKYSVTRL